MKITNSKSRLLIGIFILFYSVGIGLFSIEQTRSLFIILTPFSLIFSFGAVLLFQKEWPRKQAFAFVFVFIVSLIIEIIGVNTGILFGNYVYGPALGIKIFDTPLLIGLNWLILVYFTSAIVNHHLNKKITRIFVGSAIMVGYDALLEYVAPVMHMWSWDTSYPGIRNFIMWFFMALVFHTLFQKLELKIDNKPARFLFLIQCLFFTCILIISILTLFPSSLFSHQLL